MSTTLDYVRTSDRYSKPALGMHGEILGQRLYTMKFSEMFDRRDYEGKQPERLHRRAVKQARRLPSSVVTVSYNWETGREEYAFREGTAILAVSGEKIQVGDHVYQLKDLWVYDSDLGSGHHPHVGYVAEIRRGEGVVIDFRTDNPVSLVEETEWGKLGHVLAYENRYTNERKYRFRFCNGDMFTLVDKDPKYVAEAAEKAFRDGYYLAYLDPEYVEEQNAEALAG